MKKNFTIGILLIILITLYTGIAHEGHPNNPTRTWDDSIEKGDNFSYSVDVYQKNGETVTNENGLHEGSTITVDILGNLTEIDISSLEGIFFTDWSDYFQIMVDDGSSEQLDTPSAFLFVYPMIIDEGNGTMTNIFEATVENNNNLFYYPGVTGASETIDGNSFMAELVTDQVTYKYEYDLNTGLLNSYIEATDDTRIEISNKFSFDRFTPSSFISVFISVTILAIIVRYNNNRYTS